jgi:DMSO/TMAO reductase YedYZ molybdopterin-dependent catalytic subunit
MKPTGLITRRRAIVAGLASISGVALARYSKALPPTYGNLLRMGDNLTYAAHRTLLPGESLAKEYTASDITSFPAVGTIDPGTSRNRARGDDYRRLQGAAFADWRLAVEGRVGNPALFSLADLKRLHARTQITRHTCEEGWAAIGQWTGVPLSVVLEAAGMLPSARYVSLHAQDGGFSSIDLLDALHPQTILAYSMNGRDLPVQHGAPLRLRVERQIGYKSLKYVQRIVVSDEFDDGGKGGDIQNGWAWYTGI